MSVTISLNQEKSNSINFFWGSWPTNVFSLWIPECWGFSNDKVRLWVQDPLEWKCEAGTVRVDVKHHFEEYCFAWRLELTPEEDSVKLELRVTNTGTVTLPSFFHINGCLNFINAPDFMDSTGASTFFRTGKGWQSMVPWRRRQSLQQGHDPYHILLEGCEDSEDVELLEDVHTVSSLCVRHSRDNQHAIGFAWDSPLRIDINFNRQHCIHSVPRIGPLSPGEAKTILGKIYFHEGTKDELVHRLEEDGLS